MTFMPPQPPFDSSTPSEPVQPSYNSAPLKYTPLAWVSFSFGIGGMILFFVGPLFGLIAIITGHIARSKIKHQPLNLKGSGAALTGLITGYLSVILGSLLIAAAIFLPVALQDAKNGIEANVKNDVTATVEQAKATGDYSKYSIIQTSGDTEVEIFPGAAGAFVVMGHSPDLDKDGFIYAYSSVVDKYFVTTKVSETETKLCTEGAGTEAERTCVTPDEFLEVGLGVAPTEQLTT